MRRFRTKVITDESQVPAGFKRICSLATGLTNQKKLSDAHTDGLIDAVKLMRSTDDRTGPVWVDAEAAKRILANGSVEDLPKARATQATNSQIEAAVLALCEINNGITLMQATLERLTAAVESIATQPQTTQQELLQTMNGNGFHS